jgi:hypothetical protein
MHAPLPCNPAVKRTNIGEEDLPRFIGIQWAAVCRFPQAFAPA